MTIERVRVVFKRHTSTLSYYLHKCLQRTTCFDFISGHWGDCALVVTTSDGEVKSYTFKNDKRYIQITTGELDYHNFAGDASDEYKIFEVPVRNASVKNRLEEFLLRHTEPPRVATHHTRGYWNHHCCCWCQVEGITLPPHSTKSQDAFEQWCAKVLNHDTFVMSEFILTALLFMDPEWADLNADHLDNPYQVSVNHLYETFIALKFTEIAVPIDGVEINYPLAPRGSTALAIIPEEDY